MKTFLFSVVALIALAGAAGADDKPKLSKDDFDLGRKVDKIQDDVTVLIRQVSALTDKVDKLTTKLEAAAQVPAEKLMPPPAKPVSQRPAGDGWQYDAPRDVWWKYADPVQAPSYGTPSFGSSGGCVGGNCSPPPQSFGRFRR